MNKKIPPPPNKGTPPKPPAIIQKEKIYLDNNIETAPPHAIDLERCILGCYLLGIKDALEYVDLLFPYAFYDKKHQLLFAAIESLHRQNHPVDLRTVLEELSKKGTKDQAGGDYYAIELTQGVSSSAHLDFWIRIILQKYALRELIHQSRAVMFKSLHKDPDVFKLLDDVQDNAQAIINKITKNIRQEQTKDAEDELVNKFNMVQKGETSGVYWGISEWDEWAGGAQNRELIIVAARPGMGKTTVGLSVSGTAAFEKGIPIAFFSLEMSKTDLMFRLAARVTTIDYGKIRKGQLTVEELDKVRSAINYIKKQPLHIVDTSEHKNVLERIIAKIRELVKQGVKEVFIDYVQLIKLAQKSSDRTADLSEITRELKATANELNIPIILFAQLNRSVESRPGNVPMLSDLKQSGSIEEDADMVIFLLREAYYREKDSVGVEIPKHVAGDTKFIVAKGRNTGTRTFRCYIDFTKYTIQSYSDADI